MGRRPALRRSRRGGIDDGKDPEPGPEKKKRKIGDFQELSMMPKSKKVKKMEAAEKTGRATPRGRGRKSKAEKIDTPPSTPSTSKKGNGKKGRGRGRRSKCQMVLDDDDDRDYIDYESPEEMPIYEDEDAPCVEEEDQESTEVDSQSQGTQF